MQKLVDKQRTLIRIYMEKYIYVWRKTNDIPRIRYVNEPGFTHVQRPTFKANFLAMFHQPIP